jgi:hypothetical protein
MPYTVSMPLTNDLTIRHVATEWSRTTGITVLEIERSIALVGLAATQRAIILALAKHVPLSQAVGEVTRERDRHEETTVARKWASWMK